MFTLVQDGGLKIVDSVSCLIQRGCKLFRLNQFTEGGTYIRGAFILVESLFRDMATKEQYHQKEPPIWIFGLWKLLTEDVPHDISKLFLSHVMAMIRQVLPAMHPAQEIMRCLYRAHNGSPRDAFTDFILSTWIDSTDEISCLINSSWLHTAACLPAVFWMGDTGSRRRQLQETAMEFRRVEDVETWKRRNTDLAFPLCDQKQLFYPAPSHTEILTLMWLRHTVVESNKIYHSTRLSEENYENDQGSEIHVFESATLTRLELSIGNESREGGCDNVRILSGDVYQVGYLHNLQQEEIQILYHQHNLKSHAFEKATAMFQATHGIEVEKGAWFQWLQILEDSLIGRRNLPRVCERKRAESIISHELFRNKGFRCNYMATQYGEIGIAEERRDESSELQDGYMYVHLGRFQN